MQTILIVENEKAVIQQVQESLSHAGYAVLFAFDGFSGLQMATERKPDFIIIDAMIPEMSGYDLCKTIKNAEATKSIPVVVLTDNHRMEDAFLFLGVYGVLNKPFLPEELERLVKKKLFTAQVLEDQKTKILIYGMEETLKSCEKLLNEDGHWTGFFCEDCNWLLQKASKFSPDVIFMDLQSKPIAADELVRQLRDLPAFKNTPILTYYVSEPGTRESHSMQTQMIGIRYIKALTIDAGASEYLGAFNPATFLNLVNIYRKDLL